MLIRELEFSISTCIWGTIYKSGPNVKLRAIKYRWFSESLKLKEYSLELGTKGLLFLNARLFM